MQNIKFSKAKIYFTLAISIAIWALLVYDFLHNGVPSHHILNKKDLPEISNWWGGILLPILSYLVFSRIENRDNLKKETLSKLPKQVSIGFVVALIMSILISTFFTYDHADIPFYLLVSILVSSIFYPIYKAECLLGFVIGMTFTFGAVLPTGIGSILAIIGFMIYKVIRLGLLFLKRSIL